MRNPVRNVPAQKGQVSKTKRALGGMITELLVRTQEGAGGGFSPSVAGSEAFGGELPGLVDGSHRGLEWGALRAQGNARPPRSCLRARFMKL